jgi:hypothetical protein
VFVLQEMKKMNDDEHFIENAPLRSGDTSKHCGVLPKSCSDIFQIHCAPSPNTETLLPVPKSKRNFVLRS